jgi:hypothetical protein
MPEDLANSKEEIGPRRKPSPPAPWRHPALKIGDAMMVVVSLIVLCSALYIILSRKFDDSAEKWAFGMVGSIVGFWCRRSR